MILTKDLIDKKAKLFSIVREKRFKISMKT